MIDALTMPESFWNNDIKQPHHIREFIATEIQPLQLCQSVDGPEEKIVITTSV